MLLKGKQIFIVEDNLQNRVVFTIALKLQGADINFDRWGNDAVWRLKAYRHVDLIVLDLMLHDGISGFDIFDEIRRLPRYDNTPIVAVSAAEPSIALPKTREKGFNGFIAKPIDDELFPRQLLRLMSGEPVWYAGERYQGVGG